MRYGTHLVATAPITPGRSKFRTGLLHSTVLAWMNKVAFGRRQLEDGRKSESSEYVQTGCEIVYPSLSNIPRRHVNHTVQYSSIIC